ncbi:unnamed protein product [Ixodes persulcatus]
MHYVLHPYMLIQKILIVLQILLLPISTRNSLVQSFGLKSNINLELHLLIVAQVCRRFAHTFGGLDTVLNFLVKYFFPQHCYFKQISEACLLSPCTFYEMGA